MPDQDKMWNLSKRTSQTPFVKSLVQICAIALKNMIKIGNDYNTQRNNRYKMVATAVSSYDLNLNFTMIPFPTRIFFATCFLFKYTVKPALVTTSIKLQTNLL